MFEVVERYPVVCLAGGYPKRSHTRKGNKRLTVVPWKKNYTLEERMSEMVRRKCGMHSMRETKVDKVVSGKENGSSLKDSHIITGLNTSPVSPLMPFGNWLKRPRGTK